MIRSASSHAPGTLQRTMPLSRRQIIGYMPRVPDLSQSPILLLFTVTGLGFILGRVRLGELRLGASAVLFVGIAFSAFDHRARLPEWMTVLGLALFVYTLGLGSGPAFYASLRRRGWDQLFVLVMLALAMALTAAMAHAFGLTPPATAGLYSGALSSTPSLAAVVEQLRSSAPPALAARAMSEPVVAYSITYPASVFGMIVLMHGFQRYVRPDYRAESLQLRYLGVSQEALVTRVVQIVKDAATGAPLLELLHQHHWPIVFGPVERGGDFFLVDDKTHLCLGDKVTIVGFPDDVERVVDQLGRLSAHGLTLEQSRFGQRRLFVSDVKVAGRPIRALDLPRAFGARITRVRRGDIDFLPEPQMRLELGDRVTVVAHQDRMMDLTQFFGDSYRKLSEIDIAVFSLGIAMGLLLGKVPLPLPDGSVFRLGWAGGPLLVGLGLGIVRRTGPVVWSLPYSANLTLRQVGLIIFLACVGTASGEDFARTMTDNTSYGLQLFCCGALITCSVGLTALIVGHRVLKVPFGLLLGLIAGMQTQATILNFASDQTKNDVPTVGYASVYPLAAVVKVLAAQLLLS